MAPGGFGRPGRTLSFQEEDLWLDEEETVELEGREQSQDVLREWVQ